MITTRSFLLLATLLAPTTLAPLAARAEDASTDGVAREVYKLGIKAYDEGRFPVAVAAFRDAYALSGRADLLFNVGRAADAASELDTAHASYAAYLAAQPAAPNRAFVEGRLDALEERSTAQQPGPARTRGAGAADAQAQAAFERANQREATLERVAFVVPQQASLSDYVNALVAQVSAASARAKARVDALNEVARLRSTPWAIAAAERVGSTWETLAGAVRGTPFSSPSELREQLSKMAPDQQVEIVRKVSQSVQTVLVEKASPLECAAIQSYATAARAARAAGSKAGTIGRAHGAQALAHLGHYDDAKLTHCLADEMARQQKLKPYVKGEFAGGAR